LIQKLTQNESQHIDTTTVAIFHLTQIGRTPDCASITRILSKGSIFLLENPVAQREEQDYFRFVPCGGRACCRRIRQSQQQLIGGGSGRGARLLDPLEKWLEQEANAGEVKAGNEK